MPLFYSARFVIHWRPKELKKSSLWGEQASSQQLNKDFGTHEAVDVIKIIFEKGEKYDDDDEDDPYEFHDG